MTESKHLTEKQDVVRVRVTKGPDESMIGKIGYLFDFRSHGESTYIVTVTETDVRRLHLHEGYEFKEEPI